MVKQNKFSLVHWSGQSNATALINKYIPVFTARLKSGKTYFSLEMRKLSYSSFLYSKNKPVCIITSWSEKLPGIAYYVLLA